MTRGDSQAKIKALGPHSRALTRGAVGAGVDGRSREGRFLRQSEKELLAHIGGEPSFAQRLLVRRIAKMMLLAEKLDDKLTGGGNWTPHDARTFGALNTAITRALRDIGLKPRPKGKPTPTLADLAARHANPKADVE